jgi:hypothetical protein
MHSTLQNRERLAPDSRLDRPCQNRERFYERAVKEKSCSQAAKISWQLATQHTRSRSTLVTTPLVDRFFLPLFEPDRIVVFVVSCENCQPWFYLRLQSLRALGL